MGQVGIRDVANELGLSIATVSRAMNGHAEASPQTIERVRETAARLGYRPHQAGRALRRGATGSVALFVPVDTARTSVGETFYFALVGGLQEVLQPARLDVVMVPTRADGDGVRQVRGMVGRSIADAYVLTNTSRSDARVDHLVETRIPFVTLGRTDRQDHTALDLDFAGVARRSVQKLAADGHRLLALASDDRDITGNDVFITAWHEAVRATGLPEAPVLRVPDAADSGREVARRMLELPDRPTGLVLAQETLALGLYPELDRAGVAIGRELSVIGFRDNPVCSMLQPHLTTFHLDLHALGRRLGELVVERLAGSAVPDEAELWPLELGDEPAGVPSSTRA
jgi:DNA-binding LacI/PurR family transcriptional regulator